LRDELRFHPLAALFEIRKVFAFRHGGRASFSAKEKARPVGRALFA
jgi:hypothetical protein